MPPSDKAVGTKSLATDQVDGTLRFQVLRRIDARHGMLTEKLRNLNSSLQPYDSDLAKAFKIAEIFGDCIKAELDSELRVVDSSRSVDVARDLLRILDQGIRVIDKVFLDVTNFDVPRWLQRYAQEEATLLELNLVPLVVPSPASHFGTSYGSLKHHLFDGIRSDILDAVLSDYDIDEKDIEDLAIVRVPRLEGRHAHWLPLTLGHELAHIKLLQEGGVSVELFEIVLERMQSAIGDSEVDWPRRSVEEIPDEIRMLIQKSLPTASWSSGTSLYLWLTEIVCDLYSLKRFGPSFVCAAGSFFETVGRMDDPTNQHPRGAFRLRLMLLVLERLHPAVKSALSSLLAPWGEAAEVQDTTRLGAKSWDLILEEVAGESLTELTELASKLMGSRSDFEMESSVRPFAEAVDIIGHRFHEGLPVARLFEGELNSRNATVAELISGAWFATQVLGFEMHLERMLVKSLEVVDFLDRLDRCGFEPRLLTDTKNHTGLEVVPRPAAEHTIGATFDVRLGTRFIVFRGSAVTSFSAVTAPDELATTRRADPRQFQVGFEVDWGEPFVLHSNEFALAATLEYIGVPHDCMCTIASRSSYGRLGLVSVTASPIHAGFQGCVTLELVNLGPVPLRLYPGERLGQLTVTKLPPDVSSPSRSNDDMKRAIEERRRTKYNRQIGPTFSSFDGDDDLALLTSLRDPKKIIDLTKSDRDGH